MVITFSKYFPLYHPRSGEPTFFVEKIWKGLWDRSNSPYLGEYQQAHDNHFGNDQVINVHQFEPKWHTIRKGNRFKVGDYFDARVWSGKPYHTKQIQIAPAIKVTKVWDFKIGSYGFQINEKVYNAKGDGAIKPQIELLKMIAKNDGLDRFDLLAWFKYPKPFTGQIICWSENINY